MRDPQSQMRADIHSVLQILADKGEIPSDVKVRGVRLGSSQYQIDLENVGPMLLIPKAEGDRIIRERDDCTLDEILTDHIRLAGRIGS